MLLVKIVVPVTQRQGAAEHVFPEECSTAESAIPNGARSIWCSDDGSSFVEGMYRRILRYHKRFVVSYQCARHSSARSEVGSKRKEVAPPSRKEEVCICTESEPGISIFGIAVEVS